MVLKKVVGMVCAAVLVGGMLFASQTASLKLIAMRSPSGFINFTLVK